MKISIILPTYNWNSNWISDSIDSVLNQSFIDFELIIINDASTNDIEKTILEYVKKDNRIKYFKNENNLKLIWTLNKWIELSKWQYIARIDDDDIWINKDKLKKQVDFLDNNPDYLLCGWATILINENWDEIMKINPTNLDKDIRKNMLICTQFSHSSIMFRKEINTQIYFYDKNAVYVEDHELWLKLGSIGKFYNFPDYFLKYRYNNNWVSVKNRFKQKIWLVKLAFKYKSNYPNFYNAFLIQICMLFLNQNIINLLSKVWRKLKII